MNNTETKVITPLEVKEGVWAGKVIRRARKEGRCEYWLGVPGQCKNIIKSGDLYMTGEQNGEAGGFGQERYCMDCAGADARKCLHE